MISNRSIQAIKNYLLLALSVFVFVMWSINLLSLIEIEHISYDKKQVSTKTKILKFLPFICFYLKELGFKVALMRNIPNKYDYLLVIIDNPQNNSTQNQYDSDKIIEWVRSGGKLIIFSLSESKILNELNIDIFSVYKKSYSLVNKGSISFINTIDFIKTENNTEISPKNSISIPVLVGSNVHNNQISGKENIIVLQKYLGSGEIWVISNFDFVNLDNNDEKTLEFVTLLFDKLAVNKQICFWDNFCTVSVSANTTEKENSDDIVDERNKIKVSLEKVRKKKSILSLASIVLSNPTSWSLFQVLLALILYFYSKERNIRSAYFESNIFNFSTKAESPESKFIEGLVRLMTESKNKKKNEILILRKYLENIAEIVCPKLGLSISVDNLVYILKKVEDRESQYIKSYEQAIKHLIILYKANKPIVIDSKVIYSVNVLEKIRKELGIYA